MRATAPAEPTDESVDPLRVLDLVSAFRSGRPNVEDAREKLGESFSLASSGAGRTACLEYNAASALRLPNIDASRGAATWP